MSSDPHVPATWPGRAHNLDMRSVPITADTLSRYDAVIIATAHKAFDWEAVASHARLVIDTRNAMRPYAADMGARLVMA